MKNANVLRIALGSTILLMPPYGACRFAAAAPVMALSSAAATQDTEDTDATKLFEGYPDSKAFKYFVEGQLNSEWHLKKNNLVSATWFLGGRPNIGMQCFVNYPGDVFGYRNVCNWACQNAYGSQLSGEQLNAVKAILPNLPKSTLHPPMEKLLIFSYQLDGKWVTRTYDKSALPEGVSQIYKMTQAPIED